MTPEFSRLGGRRDVSRVYLRRFCTVRPGGSHYQMETAAWPPIARHGFQLPPAAIQNCQASLSSRSCNVMARLVPSHFRPFFHRGCRTTSTVCCQDLTACCFHTCKGAAPSAAFPWRKDPELIADSSVSRTSPSDLIAAQMAHAPDREPHGSKRPNWTDGAS